MADPLKVDSPPENRGESDASRSARRGAASRGRLRVALLAGGLARGGAEKQLVYLVRALRLAGSDVRVYAADAEGFHRSTLRSLGVEPVPLGSWGGPPVRLLRLLGMLARFRPHMIQATHAFMNLYAGLAGRILGVPTLGALRSSLRFCREANGRWTRWLMSVPDGVIVNSETARTELRQEGATPPERIFMLPNAIDEAEYRAVPPSRKDEAENDGMPVAAFVGRLIPSKRLDLFLRGLATARGKGVRLRGVVIGDGPELAAGKALAAGLALGPRDCSFLGEREDLPELLGSADLLVLCSEDEGLPNVVIEAMAAGLPVVTTPAGDAEAVVKAGPAGLVVPFGDAESLAEAMVRLATSSSLRRELGAAGRELVRSRYALSALADRILTIYTALARLERNAETLDRLSSIGQ